MKFLRPSWIIGCPTWTIRLATGLQWGCRIIGAKTSVHNALEEVGRFAESDRRRFVRSWVSTRDNRLGTTKLCQWKHDEFCYHMALNPAGSIPETDGCSIRMSKIILNLNFMYTVLTSKFCWSVYLKLTWSQFQIHTLSWHSLHT